MPGTLGQNYSITGEIIGTLVAAVDLSSYKYCFVKITSAGVNLATSGEYVDGILQNAPIAGQAAIFMKTGISMLKLGTGGCTFGGKLTPQNDGSGRGVAAGTTDCVGAKAVQAGAVDNYISVSIVGSAASAVVADNLGIADPTTMGAGTTIVIAKDKFLYPVVSTGGDVTVTTLLQPAGLWDGKKIVVEGTNDTDRVLFADAPGVMELTGGVTCTLAQYDMIEFLSDGTIWSEISRSVKA